MKKFVAPQVRVIKYNTSLLCASREDGDTTSKDYNDEGNQEGGWAAPTRRGIFD